MRILFLHLFLGSIFLWGSDAFSQKLSPGEIISIFEAAEAIKEPFDKTNTLFVCVGQSPSAVAAAMSLDTEVHHVFLPISELRSSGVKPEKMSKAQEQRLNSHLENFLVIPDGIKKIVLYDVVFSGTSAKLNREYVKRYLRTKNLPIEVQTAIFSDLGTDDYLETAKALDAILIPIDQKLHGRIWNGDFKEFAPYGRAKVFNLKESLPDPTKPRDSYNSLVNLLRNSQIYKTMPCRKLLQNLKDQNSK